MPLILKNATDPDFSHVSLIASICCTNVHPVLTRLFKNLHALLVGYRVTV